MTSRPEGETRKDRRRQITVGICAVVAMFSLLGNVVLTQRSITLSSAHHAEQVQQNNQILVKDKQITTLLREHSVTFAQQKIAAANAAQYDADVKAIALQLEAQLAILCDGHVPACPVLPPLP